MAIKFSTQTSQGMTLPDAYARVVNVRYNVAHTRLNPGPRADALEIPAMGYATVYVYVDESARRASKTAVNTLTIAFPYDLNGANIVEQAYAVVKQRPEFSGAVDC